MKGVFTSGASAALIRKGFPDHSGVVVSETALIPKDLLDVSLEEVIFSAEWVPEAILPDPFPVFDSSQDDIQDITPEMALERTPEKVLEPEKEKQRAAERTPERVLEPEKEKTPRTRAERLAARRSMCPRSSTPR